jgi:hypothetical protein
MYAAHVAPVAFCDRVYPADAHPEVASKLWPASDVAGHLEAETHRNIEVIGR